MVDRPIKVDERTDRLVTDLAYFLRSSKKSVVRDAVAEFAETHHPRHLPGSGGAAEGGSAAKDGHRGAGESAEQDGPVGVDVPAEQDGPGVDEPAEQDAPVGVDEPVEQDAPVGVSEIAEPRGPVGAGMLGEDSGTATSREFGSATNGGGLAGSRLRGARARGVTFEMLDPLERLALRRRELLRRFAELGGTNVRVFAAADEPGASGEGATRLVLLAETDPVDGSAAVPALEEVARHVLGAHVTVVSLTSLRWFGSGRLELALAQSRPL